MGRARRTAISRRGTVTSSRTWYSAPWRLWRCGASIVTWQRMIWVENRSRRPASSRARAVSAGEGSTLRNVTCRGKRMRSSGRPESRRGPPLEELPEFDHAVPVRVDFGEPDAALLVGHLRSELVHEADELAHLQQAVPVVVDVVEVLAQFRFPLRQRRASAM